MDLLQLEYFIKVADLEHMTRAAQELHIAQPALSKTIHQFERELGCELFMRDGRNIKLTEMGRIVQQRGKRILGEVDALQKDLQMGMNKLNNSISLAIQVASEVIPPLIDRFKREHPDTTISIVQFNKEDVDVRFSDICITSTTHPVHESWACTVLEEPICLAIPSNHPLCQQKEIFLSDVVGEPFIGLHRGGNLAEIVHYYCSQVGFTPNTVLSCDSPSTLRHLINLGLGFAFVPVKTWRSVREEPIVLRHISGLECKRYINVCWRRYGYISPVVDQFRDMAIEFFRQYDKEPPADH